MNKKVIKTTTYVNAPGIIRTDFFDPDFSVLVDNKGYDAVWERAIPCPCAKRQGAVMSSCKNCQGTGWVFINPKQIKVIAQSLNKDTKYKEWSQERLGTASFTVRPEYHLGFMDKITLLNSSSVESENRIVYSLGNELLISTIYAIDEVIDVFKFVGPDWPLQLISKDDYSIASCADFNLDFSEDFRVSPSPSFLEFKSGVVKVGDSVTISYKHKVQYHILDLNHDVRNTIVLDNDSREQPLALPISAIGRRVAQVIDASNYQGDNLFDNSYEF